MLSCQNPKDVCEGHAAERQRRPHEVSFPLHLESLQHSDTHIHFQIGRMDSAGLESTRASVVQQISAQFIRSFIFFSRVSRVAVVHAGGGEKRKQTLKEASFQFPDVVRFKGAMHDFGQKYGPGECVGDIRSLAQSDNRLPPSLSGVPQHP